MATCDEYQEVVGRLPTGFIRMVHESDAVEAATRVIQAEPLPDGFADLVMANRLDLTAEHFVVTHPEYHSLFDKEVIEKARNRLRRVGWNP